MTLHTTTINAGAFDAPRSRSFVRFLPTISRLLLGGVFLVMGLNGFLGFLSAPPLPQAAADFFGALVRTGYMIPLIMVTQVSVGLLLLLNRFVPLALALIAPVVVNILAFHLALAPGGLPLAGAVLGLELYLAWCYRASFRSMLAPHPHPA